MTRTTDIDRLGGSTSPAPLLLGQMKVPNWLLTGINRINREAVDTRLLKPDAVVSEALAARLEGWDLQLSPYMRDNPSNLAHYAAPGLCRI